MCMDYNLAFTLSFAVKMSDSLFELSKFKERAIHQIVKMNLGMDFCNAFKKTN